MLDVTDLTAVAAFVTAADRALAVYGICVTNSGGPPSNMFKNVPPEAGAALAQLLLSTISFAGETLPRMQMNSEDV